MRIESTGLDAELYALRAQLDEGNIDLRLYHRILHEIKRAKRTNSILAKENHTSFCCNRKEYVI